MNANIEVLESAQDRLDTAACVFEQMHTLFLTLRREAEEECSAVIIANLTEIGERIAREVGDEMSLAHAAVREAMGSIEATASRAA